MAIDENDPRLKDMLRAIELGDLPEDLPPDPEEYDDMGGIKSLDRGAPSIKMASETRAEELDLEGMSLIREFEDLKEKGVISPDTSFDDFMEMYLSKKKKSPNMQMAGMGNVMKLFETPYGFDRDGFEENIIQFKDYQDGGGELGLYDFTLQGMGMVKKDMPKERDMAAYGGRMNFADGPKDPTYTGNNLEDLPEGLKRDTTTYPLGQDPRFNDKLINRPDTKGMTILKLKELIEKRKKEKKKLAKGGIAGVL
jgi:hypothetical protein